MRSEWFVVCKPQTVRSDDGKNMSGIVVFLRKREIDDQGETKVKTFGDEEVARVAFDRTNSKNPRISFDVQLAKVRNKAQSAVETLNDVGDPLEGME